MKNPSESKNSRLLSAAGTRRHQWDSPAPSHQLSLQRPATAEAAIPPTGFEPFSCLNQSVLRCGDFLLQWLKMMIGLGDFWPRPKRGRLRRRPRFLVSLLWIGWFFASVLGLLALLTAMGMGGVSLLPLGLAKVFQGGDGSLSWQSGRSKTAPCWRLPRWVSRSFWATWLSDYLQPHLTDLVGQFYPWVWIWDPGDLLLGLLLNCAIFIPLGVLFLLAGRLFIPKFYKKSQYNYIVSTTIKCLGEQCSLCWDESSIDWSADPLHAQIADSDGWIYKSQGRDNSFVVGNYLEEAGDLPSVSARFSRKVLEHCIIVQGQLVGVVHFLVCPTLALGSSNFWPLYAPYWDALMSDFNR